MAGVWGVPEETIPGPGLPAVQLLKSLGQPDGVRCLFVHASNIAVASPDANAVIAGLRSLDFLVVCDFFMSETAAEADLILPVLQWAEEEGTLTNLEGRVLRRRRAIQPPAGARSELWIMARLAEALEAPSTYSEDPETVFEELRLASAGGLADYSGIDYAMLDRGEAAYWPYPAGSTGTPRLFLDTFAHADGKAVMTPVTPRRRRTPAANPDPAAKTMTLITGRLLEHYQSGAQTRRVSELLATQPEAKVQIHPAAAAAMGITEGAFVSVANERGEVVCRAELSTAIRPETVFLPFHFPELESANRLTEAATDPISGMPEFKFNKVWVRAGPATSHRTSAQRSSNDGGLMSEQIVIVGFGPVAARLIDELLPAVRDGHVSLTVVGEEAEAAYNRVLVADLGVGRTTADALALSDAAALIADGVDVRLGVRVRRVDRARQQVLLTDGTTAHYERLVFATGSRPVIPNLTGINPDPASPVLPAGVTALRDLRDASVLRAAVDGGKRVVVLGGGVLGLETALAAAEEGATVTVVHNGPHPLGRNIDRGGGAVLAASLRRCGVRMAGNARSTGVEHNAPDGGFSALLLDDGSAIDGDLLVLSCGVRPRTELAEGCGLSTGTGILVDHRLRAHHEPHIFAIGDCAEVRCPDPACNDCRTAKGPSGLVGPGWRQAEWLAEYLTLLATATQEEADALAGTAPGAGRRHCPQGARHEHGRGRGQRGRSVGRGSPDGRRRQRPPAPADRPVGRPRTRPLRQDDHPRRGAGRPGGGGHAADGRRAGGTVRAWCGAAGRQVPAAAAGRPGPAGRLRPRRSCRNRVPLRRSQRGQDPGRRGGRLLHRGRGIQGNPRRHRLRRLPRRHQGAHRKTLPGGSRRLIVESGAPGRNCRG